MVELTLTQVLGADMQRSKLLTVQMLLNALRSHEQLPPLRGLDPDIKIPLKYAAVIWTIAHIAQRRIIDENTLLSVVQMFPGELIAIGQSFEDTGLLQKDMITLSELPAKIIAVADRRYVTITGLAGHFDLAECRVLPAVPLTFEGVSYNVAAPILKECVRIQQERNHGSKAPDPSRTIRPSNAGTSPFSVSGGPPRGGVSGVGSINNPHGARGSERGGQTPGS